MTKARAKVLSLLSSAKEPLSASCLVENVKDLMDQATVYRALHYLEKNGYANSFVLHCFSHGTERYYTAVNATENASHRHWFHCEGCHKFTDLGECILDSHISDYEKKHHFTIHTHTLYLTGLCKKCSLTKA